MSKGTALITGGAKRLGAAIAMHLAKMGYDIIIHYNNSLREAQNLQKKIIKNMAVNCHIIKADLADETQIAALIKEVKKDFKNWNVLINSASIFSKSGLVEGGLKELKANFAIHLMAPALLAMDFAKHCQAKKINGNIINMVDKNITRYDTKYFPYLLSKKTLAEFTKMAALELAPQIRVNGVAPGFILNSIDESSSYKDDKKTIAKIPLQKKGEEKDIVSAIQYLLENNFITGQIIFVDGGASLNHAG
jgi:pteridine reductase